jgi:hypothetical protein
LPSSMQSALPPKPANGESEPEKHFYMRKIAPMHFALRRMHNACYYQMPLGEFMPSHVSRLQLATRTLVYSISSRPCPRYGSHPVLMKIECREPIVCDPGHILMKFFLHKRRISFCTCASLVSHKLRASACVTKSPILRWASGVYQKEFWRSLDRFSRVSGNGYAAFRAGLTDT